MVEKFITSPRNVIDFGRYQQGRGVGKKLLEAVMSRDQKAVAALIKSGADVNAARADGSIPLAWAINREDAARGDRWATVRPSTRTCISHGIASGWARPRIGRRWRADWVSARPRSVSGLVCASSNDLCVAGDATAMRGWCHASEAGHRIDA